MRSGISFFDAGVCKNLLRRCWPLWAAYFLALLIMLPVNLGSFTAGAIGEERAFLSQNILRSGVTSLAVSFVVSGLAALAMFSFLYNSRSCGMMCSLPLRRETLFSTACLTGILPMLLADLLVFGVTALIFGGEEYFQLGYLAQWLALVAMGNVSFYGIAVFCAMLTGSAVIMPAAYVVLNLAAYVAEGAIRALMGVFIYGFCYTKTSFTWLPPLVNLGKLGVMAQYDTAEGASRTIPTGFYVEHMDMLAAYCVAGIVLMALALLIFRRRRMETAGDAVAVKALRPVFKYCMALGGAVVFACCMDQWVFPRTITGGTAALLAAGMMLIGAFIGYFAAEMLMQKTLGVFRSGFKGFAVSCCVLLSLAAVCEFDLFGYERAVPDPAVVERIETSLITEGFSEPENLEAFTALHKQIIAHKAQNESADSGYYFAMHYYLKDGSTLERLYSLDSGDAACSDPDSDLMRWQELCNTEELTRIRSSFKMPVSAETIGMCNLSYYCVDEEGNYTGDNVALTTEQALELYNECVLPDIRDGHMARYWVIQSGDYYDVKSNTSIYLELVDRQQKDDSNDKYESMEFIVQMDSQRCLQWLEENTDIEPLSQREANKTLIDDGFNKYLSEGSGPVVSDY